MPRHWITITIVLALIAGGIMLLDSPAVVLPGSEPSLFDESEAHLVGYLTDVTTTQYQADGSVEYRFTAERLSRYQAGRNETSLADFTLIGAPSFIIYQEDDAPWHIVADAGESRENDELFILQSKVRVWQDDPERGRTELSTEKMRFRPQPQIAETDEFVKITHGRGRSQGYGMHGDLKQETLQILSEGKTVYEPNP